MLFQPLYDVGGIKQPVAAGDILNTREQTVAIDGAADATLVGRDITRGEMIISGGAAIALTLPSAEDIIKQLVGSIGLGVANASFQSALNTQFVGEFGNLAQNMLPPQSSFRRVMINNNSNTVTLAAPATSGISISGTATIPTVNWREFIIRILATGPTQLIPGITTTNASKVLSNVDAALMKTIRVGMSIYGTGIGASAKVTAVNVDARTITTDVNSSATADNIAVTFTPTVIVQTLRGGTLNN